MVDGNVTNQITGNYVVDHWHGRHSLVRAYWVNAVLGSVLARIVMSLIQRDIDPPSYSQSSPALVPEVALLGLGFTVWALVGAWRSAGRYDEERGGHPRWGAVAKCAIVLGGLITIANAMRSFG